MNSFLVIAALVLTGFSFASAASLNFGNVKQPELIKDFEESVQSLLRDATEQVKNLNSVDYFDLKTEDVGDQLLVTVEEEEMKAKFCKKRGHLMLCCNSTHFLGKVHKVCVAIHLRPNIGMYVRIFLNGHHLMDHFLKNGKTYAACARNGHLLRCVVFYGVHIASDRTNACIVFLGKYHKMMKVQRLGCLNETRTADESLMKLTQGDQNEDILSFQEEDIKTDEVFNFKQ